MVQFSLDTGSDFIGSLLYICELTRGNIILLCTVKLFQIDKVHFVGITDKI